MKKALIKNSQPAQNLINKWQSLITLAYHCIAYYYCYYLSKNITKLKSNGIEIILEQDQNHIQ